MLKKKVDKKSKELASLEKKNKDGQVWSHYVSSFAFS